MDSQIPQGLHSVIPASLAWRYHILPKSVYPGGLEIFADSSMSIRSVDDLSVITGKEIKVIRANTSWLDTQLKLAYPETSSKRETNLNVDSEQFIEQLIHEASSMGSSDIHIEPYHHASRIRMRVDGKLIVRYQLDHEKYHEYVNKIKILCNLDIAEKRLPQDGRVKMSQSSHPFDIRVSIMPTLYGEKVVLRLLTGDSSRLEIADLGMDDIQKLVFMKAICKTQGLIIISGPTGAGKTTTLYSALKYLNRQETNILTIEDPIEYTMSGVNQVQLNAKVGLDFARTLRTFLRQDPDVIMVGEIRDNETAKVAIRAAMTGHLVLSTLHTNSAAGILSRLEDMGIPRYLLMDTINVAVAQRLLRKLCPHCKIRKQEELPLEVFPKDVQIQSHSFHPEGCDQCHGSGFSGRKAIYEMVCIQKPDGGEPHLAKVGSDLRAKAVEMFQKGETSFKEVQAYLL